MYICIYSLYFIAAVTLCGCRIPPEQEEYYISGPERQVGEGTVQSVVHNSKVQGIKCVQYIPL